MTRPRWDETPRPRVHRDPATEPPADVRPRMPVVEGPPFERDCLMCGTRVRVIEDERGVSYQEPIGDKALLEAAQRVLAATDPGEEGRLGRALHALADVVAKREPAA